MARLARERVVKHAWTNATLIQARAENAALPGQFDALLFNFTHGVLKSSAALAHLFRAARPGTRVAAAGSKLLPWWLAPANVYVRRINAPYPCMTTFDGLSNPWRYLASFVLDLRINPRLCSTA